MSADRWARLAESLAVGGVEAHVDERTYPGGIRRGITLRAPAGVIDIRDTWWRDTWTGWQVSLEGGDAIELRSWSRTKKRSEVVAAVLEGLRWTASVGENAVRA